MMVTTLTESSFIKMFLQTTEPAAKMMLCAWMTSLLLINVTSLCSDDVNVDNKSSSNVEGRTCTTGGGDPLIDNNASISQESNC